MMYFTSIRKQLPNKRPEILSVCSRGVRSCIELSRVFFPVGNEETEEVSWSHNEVKHDHSEKKLLQRPPHRVVHCRLRAQTRSICFASCAYSVAIPAW